MPSINSKAISWAEYNEETGDLALTFAKGNTYTYYGVPKELYSQFLSAPSQGEFFNQFIKDQYGS